MKLIEKTIVNKLKEIDLTELKKIRCLDTNRGDGVFAIYPEITTAYLMCKTPKEKPIPDIHDLIGFDDMQTIAEIVSYVDQLQKCKK